MQSQSHYSLDTPTDHKEGATAMMKPETMNKAAVAKVTDDNGKVNKDSGFIDLEELFWSALIEFHESN